MATETKPDTEIFLESGEYRLTLDGRRYDFLGDASAIRVENSDFIVQKAGTYRLSGTLREGSIVIDVGYGESVRLILDGVSLCGFESAPILVRRAAAVIVESVGGTVNTLSDVKRDGAGKEAWHRSVIYADSDLCFRGDGTLVISGVRGQGVHATGDLCVQGGKLTVSAPEEAILSHDRVILEGGQLSVTEATVGISVGESGGVGAIEMTGGRVAICCEKTAFLATREISLSGGTGSLRCPKAYLCRETVDGKTVEGKISVAENWLEKN